MPFGRSLFRFNLFVKIGSHKIATVLGLGSSGLVGLVGTPKLPYVGFFPLFQATDDALSLCDKQM